MKLFQGPLLVSGLFFFAALASLGILPLWLDEVLQLLETRDTQPVEMLRVLPRNPGAAPLGYLVQQASLRVTGYGVRRARFPMAVFGAGAVLVVGLLAAELRVAMPWLASAIFAFFPLTFRYATEGRIYSQALFFSVLTTWLFLRGSRWGYAAALTCAVYSQTFAVWIGVALLVWALRDRRMLWRAGIGLTVAAALFAPWFLYSHDMWAGEVGAGMPLHFAASWKTPLMLLREITGAGYWGAGLLIVLCVLARVERRSRELLLLLVAVPLVCGFAADALFDYFLAARQFIWVLPALAILATSAVATFPRCGWVLALALCGVGVMQSWKYFTASHENFEIAAREAKSRAMCVRVAPPELTRLYTFFEPELHDCDASSVVVVVTPYSTAQDAAVAETTLKTYRKVGESVVGGSRLLWYQR